MKYKITIIIFLICFCSTNLFPQELLPSSTTGQIIKHTYYTLSYSEPNEQAEWVYYELTPVLIRGKQSRTDDYRPDSTITIISAQLDDYRGSGYDRGHLCPAGDMKLNHTSMSESFYLSNCSPQDRDSPQPAPLTPARRYLFCKALFFKICLLELKISFSIR